MTTAKPDRFDTFFEAERRTIGAALALTLGDDALGFEAVDESQSVEDETGSYREQAWAQDCATGERTAIEPFSRYGEDGESESDTSIGNRTFTLSGDAEGNVWRIVDDFTSWARGSWLWNRGPMIRRSG